MVLYSIILFLTGVPMAGISLAIYRGKTSLIHEYHQTKVTERIAYGKAFGKAMFVISISMLLSGVAGLLGDSALMAWITVAILFAGLFAGIAGLIMVQIKYNKGIF